jgi:anaphase-promoting complex subunit 10
MDEEEETTQGIPDLASAIAPSRPELGRLAQWSVSSHKYGFGVDNLRDDNEGTFWQCVGPRLD